MKEYDHIKRFMNDTKVDHFSSIDKFAQNSQNLLFSTFKCVILTKNFILINNVKTKSINRSILI